MLVYGDGRTVGTIGGGSTRTTRSGRRATPSHASGAAGAPRLSDDFAQEAASSAADRWTSTSADRATPDSTSSAPDMSALTSRVAHEVGFHVRVVDDREKFANAGFPSRRNPRRTSRVDRAPACRPTPTSSSSRAATPTISRRCAGSRRNCAIWASSAAARWRGSTLSWRATTCRPGAQAGPRSHRPRHRRRDAAGNRRQHRRGDHRGQTRQRHPVDAVDATDLKLEVKT